MIGTISEMPQRSVNYLGRDTETLEVPMRSNLTLEERFWLKVTKTDTCWLWTGALGRGGYGRFRAGTRTAIAHRFAYELARGPIPPGLTLDHLCRVHECVNPAHLDPATIKENSQRGVAGAVNALRQRAKTHCKQGHEFTPANTNIDPQGYRHCRTCSRLSAQRQRDKNRGG